MLLTPRRSPFSKSLLVQLMNPLRRRCFPSLLPGAGIVRDHRSWTHTKFPRHPDRVCVQTALPPYIVPDCFLLILGHELACFLVVTGQRSGQSSREYRRQTLHLCPQRGCSFTPTAVGGRLQFIGKAPFFACRPAGSMRRAVHFGSNDHVLVRDWRVASARLF